MVTSKSTSSAADDLERRLFQLETLYEIGRECARVASVGEVLRVILSMVNGSFGVVRGLAFIGDANGTVEELYTRGLSGNGQTAASLAQTYLLTHGSGGWLRAAEMELSLPFQLDGGTLGVIALGPKFTGQPYSPEDQALLQTIVDNAVAYLHNAKLTEALRRTAEELARKVQALGISNEIALGLATRPSPRRLQRFLLDRIASVTGAGEAALVMQEGGQWSLGTKYLRDGAVERVPAEALPQRLERLGQTPEDPGEVLLPLQYGDGAQAGLWLLKNPDAGGFNAEERQLLEFLAAQASLILENSRLLEGFLAHQQEQFRLRGILEQYLAPAVAERLISGETHPLLEGTRLPITVLMADMRASTRLITQVEPETMVLLLNEYLGMMTDVLFRYEGTVDKFGGDSILGFFGAPERHEDDPLRAVQAALDMRREFASLRARWAETHAAARGVGIGIGIAAGDVIIGNIGSAKRIEHTIIGPAVNLAARLTARAPAGAIQVDEGVWKAIGPALVGQPTAARRPRLFRMKGFEALIPVYQVKPGDLTKAL